MAKGGDSRHTTTPSSASPLPAPSARPQRVRIYGTVTIVWLVSYLWAVAAGCRFTTSLAEGGWQFAPYRLLVSDPFTTSFGMTVQPPLWNLIVGVIAAWSPFGAGFSLQVLIAATSLTIGLLAARLALLVELGASAAVVIGCIAAFQPSTWQTVFGVAYELPTAMLLLLLLNVIVTCGGRLTRRHLIGATAVTTALVLVRTVYHPIWLLAAIVLFLRLARPRVTGRSAALILGLPVILVGALIIKNATIAGTPSLASWEGMNLLRSVQVAIPEADLQHDYSSGDVSAVATTPSFSPYVAYRPFMPPCSTTGDGVRDVSSFRREAGTSFIGNGPSMIPNFNYRCYQPVFQQARRDAMVLIMRHPDRWLEARLVSTRTWFTDYPPAWSWLRPIHDATHVNFAAVDLSDWNDTYPHWIFGMEVSLVGLADFLVLLAASGYCLLRLVRGRQSNTDVLILGTLVLYLTTMIPSIVFELGEQARFRSMVDPMTATTIGVVVLKMFQVLRERRLGAVRGRP